MRAVGCDPGSAVARGELGNAELQTGDARGAIAILREAEGSAEQGPTQRAIAHNLAKAFDAAGAPELARRARLREARLKTPGQGPGDGSACPVIVQRDDATIKQGSWLDAHGDIGFSSAPKPRDADEARRLCCWGSSGGDEPKLGDGCEKLDSWSIENATSAFAFVGNFVWRLDKDRAAWSTGFPQGGTFCPLDARSSASSAEARREGDFIVVESSTTDYAAAVPPVPPADGASSPCVAIGTSRTVQLFDLGLERGFSLQSLAADVAVELEPETHAVKLSGRFCDERVLLAEVP